MFGRRTDVYFTSLRKLMSQLAINPFNKNQLVEKKKVQDLQNLQQLVGFMNKVPGYAPKFTEEVNQRLFPNQQ